jgi:diguanylate cyclase (GGDEF)-like protein
MNYNAKDNMSLEHLLSSKDWSEYFQSLARTINVEFDIYNDNNERIFLSDEPPLCKFIRTSDPESITCPDACNKEIFNSLKINEPLIYKCRASLVNFAFLVERFGEKAIIIGRGGFAEYDDLLDFMKFTRDNNLTRIPAPLPLNFPGMDYINSVSRYVCLTVGQLLNNLEEKYKLEEKLVRMTALFDNQTFGTLSKNPELMYRYIMDTIEFVFGSTSASLMLLDEGNFNYNTVYSTGEQKDPSVGFSLDTESPIIYEMLNTKAAVFSEDPEKIASLNPLQNIKSAYFFPIFMGGAIEGIIGIYDKQFSSEDMRIMNAFKDYIQLNLENQHLRTSINKAKAADSGSNSLVGFSDSLYNIRDKDSLLNTLLEKTLHMLEAEQGSLMLMDPDTSELVVEARRSYDDTVQAKMRLKANEGIAGQVLENGGPLLVADIEEDPRIKQGSRPRYKTKSFISVPIKIENKFSGVINISDKIKGHSFDDSDLNVIQSIINSATVAIERSLLYKRAEVLQKLSITDHLTGIYNRRYLNRRLSEEITRYNRYKHSFSFMMLDMDKFKEYNDTYGHIPGDNLIREVASVLDKSLRTIDIAARFGGDEFVAIFPQTSKIDAIQITNRLKEKIDEALGQHNVDVPLSVSMGLATFPDDANSIMELIEKTDQALYLAKKAGGNRVVYL